MSDDIANLILEQLRLVRREMADIRTVVLQNIDQTRRVERRMEEMRSDLELMLKAELMGRFGHFEIQVDHRLDQMAERMVALEERTPRG